MLRTAVPTFASSWAWRRVVRAATGGNGVKALAVLAARSKQALARRIAPLVGAGELWQYCGDSDTSNCYLLAY